MFSASAIRLERLTYRMRRRLARLLRALRYAAGRLSPDEAQSIMLDCRHPAGLHPLLLLTVEDTLDQAREVFADHLELPRLITDGCARVGRKWEPYGDELYEARRWAIEVAEGYAVDEGVTLVSLDNTIKGAAP
jgi:hypothetical protein